MHREHRLRFVLQETSKKRPGVSQSSQFTIPERTTPRSIAGAPAIREFGFKIPVLARIDGEVVDGPLRPKGARKLGSRPGPEARAGGRGGRFRRAGAAFLPTHQDYLASGAHDGGVHQNSVGSLRGTHSPYSGAISERGKAAGGCAVRGALAAEIFVRKVIGAAARMLFQSAIPIFRPSGTLHI